MRVRLVRRWRIPAVSTTVFYLCVSLIILYVLKGESDKRYVGITNNLERRLTEHRNKSTKGGHILGKFDVLLTEEYPDYKSARNREKFLKSGQGRSWLDELEQRTRPARGG